MNDLSLYEQILPVERNFPIKFHEIKPHSIGHTHWHEHFELLFCPKETAEIRCEGTLYHPKANELVIVSPNGLHQVSGSDCLCLRVHPSFFSDIAFESVLFPVHIPADRVISDCFAKIRYEIENRPEGYDLAVKGLTYRLFCHLLRQYKTVNLSPHERLLRQNHAHIIGKALEYIGKHSREKISASSLAAQFHFNESYFCKLFKKRTGVSIVECINRYRIEQAVSLLIGTNQSIAKIAEAVGFDDPNYFSRVFKKQFNRSPMQYRKERQ